MTENKDKRIDLIVLTTVAALLAFALSSAAVQYMDLDPWMMYSGGRILFTIIITMPLCVLIFNSLKSFIIASAVTSAMAVILFFAWRNNGYWEVLTEKVPFFLDWLFELLFNWKTGMDMPELYVRFMTIILTALFCVALYFLIVKYFIYVPVFMFTIFIFVAQWIVVREVNKFAFFTALTILLLLYIRIVYSRRAKKIKKGHSWLSTGKLITAALPVVLIAMLITSAIPKSNEPIKWKWLDERIKYWDFNSDKAMNFKAYDFFSLAKTGFSAERGKPGHSVELDYSHVLDVYSDDISYLRGESWPFFNGVSWTNTVYTEDILEYTEQYGERQMLLEPVYGWRFIALNEWLNEVFPKYKGIAILPGTDFNSTMGIHLLPEWYTLKTMNVAYVGLETQTLFVPLYSNLTNINTLPNISVESDDTLEADERIKRNTFLNFDYLKFDRESELLKETIRQSRKGLYEETYAMLSYITNNTDRFENVQIANSMYLTLYDLYSLASKAKEINWRYTALPIMFSERIRTLSEEITLEYENNFDKVKAIEKYFTEGFTYTLTVSEIPEGRDFVDWFLFDSKEGYCTYYATSMCTMVRSLGLPARYVEGFLTPAVSTSGNRYTVLNSNAHAWVEVYFEGIGWITFEPTPPFTSILNKQDEFDISLGDDLFNDLALEDYLDGLDKYDGMSVYSPLNGANTGMGTGKAISIALLTAFAILCIVNLSVVLVRNSLFRKVTGVKKFRRGYFVVLRIVSMRGFKLETGMTLMELAAKIDDAYYMAHVSMKDITKIYYKSTYGNKPVPKEEFRKMELFYKEFRREFNMELKIWEWILYRGIIPRI